MITATGKFKEELIAMLPDFRMLRYPTTVIIVVDDTEYMVKSKGIVPVGTVVNLDSSSMKGKSWSEILEISKSLDNKTLRYTV